MNQLIGGWQWNGIFTAQGGFPLTPVIGFNNSGTGDIQCIRRTQLESELQRTGDLGDRRSLVQSEGLRDADSRNVRERLARVATGPGLFDVDTSLFKKFSDQRAIEFAVPGGGLQYFQSHQFFYPNSIDFLGRPDQLQRRGRSPRRRDLAATPARAEIDVLIGKLPGPLTSVPALKVALRGVRHTIRVQISRIRLLDRLSAKWSSV